MYPVIYNHDQNGKPSVQYCTNVMEISNHFLNVAKNSVCEFIFVIFTPKDECIHFHLSEQYLCVVGSG